MTELNVTGAAPMPERPRPRQRWYWGAGTALLAAAIAVAVIGIGPGHAPRPAPPPPPPPTSGPLGWVEKLVDAPARGNLAGDETFTKPLLDEVTRLVRSSDYYPPLFAVDGRPHPEQEVRLLFAADIAAQRVAVLALRLPAVVNDTLGRTAVLSLAAPAGTPADGLVIGITGGSAVAAVTTTTDVARPFTFINFGASLVWVGLAPPQCTISTAVDPDGRDFRDEPTGSYLVRTRDTRQPGYWRVTCDGVIEQELAAQTYAQPPTDTDVVAFIAGAGIESPPSIDKITHSLFAIGTIDGDIVTGAASLLWAGALRDPGLLGKAVEAGITVVTAPAMRVGWIVLVGVWDRYGLGGSGGTLQPFSTSTDPGALLAFAVSNEKDQSTMIVVVAPPGTTTVHMLDDSSSIVDVPVVDRLAIVPAPAHADLTTVRVQVGDGPAVPVASGIQPHPSYDWS